MHLPYTVFIHRKRYTNSGWVPAGRFILRFQGIYYLISGLWPLLHMPSFLAFTGPKTDIWLVQTAGGLAAAIGAALVTAAVRRRVSLEIRLLAFASSLVFSLIGFLYAAHGMLSRIYLGDSLLEIFFATFWFLFLFYYRR